MAFPTNGVIKNFNQADGLLTSVDSDFSILGGAFQPSIVSNQVVNGVNNYVGAYLDTPATYGPDTEVYITLTLGSDYFGVYGRLGTPGGSFTGYQASWSGSNLTLVRKDGGSDATLDTATLAKSVGDALGLECIGDQIKLYTKTGAGAWTERCSATDATYGSAGAIGFDMFQTSSMALDDFGGGTVVAGGGPSHRFMWMP